jgi:hypothetical protein
MEYGYSTALDSGFRRNDGKEQRPALTVTPVPDRVRDDGSGVQVFLFELAE